ncbi:MAG: hypothetical protein H3C57_00660 [Gammaproteobacteria bacterium]|nr:hypothetical protein [Gammaproteobacteria bacterium]
MANTRTLQRSFSGGEISPEMFGRNDDTKYQAGLARCRNFIVRPQGPVDNRPGFEFVSRTRWSDANPLLAADNPEPVRLIPFTYSTTQTMVIELGPGYFRFHSNGLTLLDAGSPYEIFNSYAAADLFDIHYVQSADVLTLVHPGYPPSELRRLGATNWTFTPIDFTPQISAPTGLTATASGHTTAKYLYEYVVTAVSADGLQESVPSVIAGDTGNLYESGGIVTVSWTAVGGASSYNVYKMQGGLFGYVGSPTAATFTDDNIAPDMGKTPPRYEGVFAGSGDYPGAVSYFEQRRVFAGTRNQPQNIWMTRSGTESNMSYSIPVRDDDRISFRVAAREANTIRHIVPLNDLMMMTSSAEWRVTSVNNDAVTPSSISVRPQSYIGASNVQPIIVNNTLLYGAARGGHVYELAYSWQASGFVTGDASIRAAHLFDDDTIVDMCYAKAPTPIAWFVTASGRLLGLTYVPEQQVGAWHWHDTDGWFESCTTVAEGDEDVLYCVVRRKVGGYMRRFIERMASRRFGAQQDAFFVDSGVRYSGAPTATVSGLNHLAGKTVSILADGAVMPQKEVPVGGTVNIGVEASVVQVGLPIEADMQTLPLAIQLQDGSAGQGRVKNVNQVWLRVLRSSGIFAGPDADNLVEAKQRTTENYGEPPALKSDEINIRLSPSWAASGQVFVRQSDPLPLTVVSLTAEVSLGG